MKDKQTGSWDSLKVTPQQLEVKITVTRGTLTAFCLIQGDRFTQGDCLIQADYLIQGEHLTQGDHLIQCCLTQGDRLMQCWLTQFNCTNQDKVRVLPSCLQIKHHHV